MLFDVYTVCEFKGTNYKITFKLAQFLTQSLSYILSILYFLLHPCLSFFNPLRPSLFFYILFRPSLPFYHIICPSLFLSILLYPSLSFYIPLHPSLPLSTLLYPSLPLPILIYPSPSFSLSYRTYPQSFSSTLLCIIMNSFLVTIKYHTVHIFIYNLQPRKHIVNITQFLYNRYLLPNIFKTGFPLASCEPPVYIVL